MLNNQVADNHKVLVELSVIPLGGDVQTNDQIAKVQNIVEKTGLFSQRTHNGTCIEGEWSDISVLIYSCYERVHDQSPHGYLKVAIR